MFTGRDPDGAWLTIIEPPLVRRDEWEQEKRSSACCSSTPPSSNITSSGGRTSFAPAIFISKPTEPAALRQVAANRSWKMSICLSAEHRRCRRLPLFVTSVRQGRSDDFRLGMPQDQVAQHGKLEIIDDDSQAVRPDHAFQAVRDPLNRLVFATIFPDRPDDVVAIAESQQHRSEQSLIRVTEFAPLDTIFP